MLSDIIAGEIKKQIDTSSDRSVEIKRNEFARKIGCVPSQINYVISTRFTPEHGYIISSRRGGGGFIRITRVNSGKMSSLMHIVNTVGECLDDKSARILLQNCVYNGSVSEEQAKIIKSAISNTVMRQIPEQYRDKIRASIIKLTFLSLISLK